MPSRKSLFILLVVLAAAPLTRAQQTKTKSTPAPAATASAAKTAVPDGGVPTYLKPETPAERQARLGTEDPGPDPDPAKTFYRYGKKYHIEKFDRRFVVATGGDPGTVRPFGYANVYKELYQQNEKWVWCWIEDKDEATLKAEATPPLAEWPAESLAYFQKTRGEFSPLEPPASPKTVTFQDSSDGLPTTGSWRNSMAIADMNGDGKLDLIAPPERGGGNLPAIFLGDGKGHWTFWPNIKWPFGLNYGSVAAADFNQDGKMDLAFGVHLDGVHVLLGDGKGTFTDSSAGLPHDYPTRRIAVADVDHDGLPDVVAISEGPTAVQKTSSGEYGKIRVFLNRNKGKSWEGMNVPDPSKQFGGDWLAVGNFNNDVYPDFVGASVYYNGPDILYVSDGAKKWKNLGGSNGSLINLLAYHFATAAGKFSSKKLDDAVVSYGRQWPDQLDTRLVPEPPLKRVIGVDRIVFTGAEPQRVSIMRWDAGETLRPVPAMGAGDFDGDGNLDLVFVRYDPREFVLLLGDGKGGFTRAKIKGLTVAPNATYDLQVADVNGDGKPDILIAYEATGNTRLGVRDGSIHVFLNRGAAADTKTVTAAAQ